ncbi:MAG TPA: SNF2 helicase-associated domain-containing protein, partial [Solirubrobacteraceae bacterium]
MIALHGIWSRKSQMCVWGEDAALPARAPKRRGRMPAKPRPRTHPFAGSVSELSDALARLGIAPAPDAYTDHGLALVLPSFEDGPQDSPQLLRAYDDGGRANPDFLHPWVVPAMALGPMPALDVLLALPADNRAGVVVGESLRFLAEAVKFALELVANGRVLPGLVRRDGEWLARWRAITVDPDDTERVRLLSASLPPVARAEFSPSTEASAPEAVVDDLLGAVVDACARRFLVDGLLPRPGRRRSARSLSTVDAWLVALADANPVVHADGLALAALAEQLDEWRGAGEWYAAHRMFRTCFRLSAPEELPDSVDDDRGAHVNGDRAGAEKREESTLPSWRVEILLQAKDDPSVLVPAEDVWSANGNGLHVPGRDIADPQERLLGGLGHALRLWPELEPALREPAPTGLDLSQEAAYSFVRNAAPALEQAGFGVLAPAWWSQRLRLKLQAEPMHEWEDGTGLLSLDGLCAYEWKVAVGDATLTVAELRELAALKMPLVMARGQWIVLRPGDVEAALAFFQGRAEGGEAPAAELLRDGLGPASGQPDLPATEIDAGGWLKELLSSNHDRKLHPE